MGEGEGEGEELQELQEFRSCRSSGVQEDWRIGGLAPETKSFRDPG
jgi:hypothetical protein